MKAFVARTLTGADSMVPEDLPALPAPGHGQVRLAMRAASLNYRDHLVLTGVFGAMTVADLIPFSDGVGEVIETGPGVWRVKPGDRVALTFDPAWIGGPWAPSPSALGRGGGIQGVLCEELLAGQEELVVLPAHLSWEEGATLPCAAVTAWHALCGSAPLLPGMSVLVQGGGGVSVFALQFARLFGARVIALTSSAERAERLTALGADAVIDYRAIPEWGQEVRRLTGGLGVDRTVETVGASTFAQSIVATRAAGRIAQIGLITGRPSATGSSAHIDPIRVGSRADFEAMVRAIDFHKLRPVIDRVFDFADAADALRHLESGAQFGKVVVRIG